MGGCCSVTLSCDQIENQVCQCLGVQTSYIHNIEKNLTALETNMEELKARRNDLSRRVEREENRGLRRLDQIQDWLSRVDTIESQVNDLLSVRLKDLQRLCLCGFCSMNLKLSYRYGKKIFMKLAEVENLKSNGVFEVVATQAQASEVVERPIQSNIVGQETVLETAWNHFIKNGVGLLVLHGMGGVGKTTLLKQINNKIKKNDFDVVIWVVVSKDLQIQKIQEEVAKKLSLNGEDWNHINEDQKACKIYNVLTKKKFVLLLDDIWEKVDLTKIGVPSPSRENRSKVVFTTRSQEVCGRMGVDVQIEVQCLSPEHSLDLFRKKIGEVTLRSHPDIPELSKIVATKCRGLPLALHVIGETMSCKQTIQEWNYAIRVLTSNATAFSVKRISLMGNKIKHVSGSLECFQLTTLFLQRNEITLGNISGEFFKSMPKLVVLDLSRNVALSKFPDGISKLVCLKYLNISRTSMECVPVGLQELKSLIHLDLECTRELSSIIGISALLSLKVLKLYGSGVAYSSKTKEELEVLEHLEILTISINSDSELKDFLSSRKLMYVA